MAGFVLFKREGYGTQSCKTHQTTFCYILSHSMIPQSLRRSNLSLRLNMARARGIKLSRNEEKQRRELDADDRREASRIRVVIKRAEKVRRISIY